MVTDYVGHQEWPPNGDFGHGYDSRHVKVVTLLDEIIMNAERNSGERVRQGLQRLLSNSLEQARAENGHMQAICYPGSAAHELDHFRICTTIAGLCCRWSRSRNTLNDLRELRALVSRHISSYDHPFEHYLLS